MARLCLISKKGSKAARKIRQNTNLTLYKKGSKPDAIVNYGLAGNRLDSFFIRNPAARRLPCVNHSIGCNKYRAVKDAEKADVRVPKTYLSIPKGEKVKNFIVKKFHSIGGIGILKAKKRVKTVGKYYQEFIENRRYELRVHAFSWTDDWRVQKRMGKPEEIAWNYKNGGFFSNVRNPQSFTVFREAIDMAKQILTIRRMSFGAVDFIVDNKLRVYFIEINSAPGFENLSEEIYIDAFDKLSRLRVSKIRKLL
jgi:glutathione synthase/RimK-type ligase-like ATP-grasp enzyme